MIEGKMEKSDWLDILDSVVPTRVDIAETKSGVNGLINRADKSDQDTINLLTQLVHNHNEFIKFLDNWTNHVKETRGLQN